ncbi:MAG: hypothetical protein IIT94_01590, partial [Prevotella sp.]|nr:hypothetical protein [Prevotella sp.]
EQGEVKKNGELINRQFKYKEEYGNGLLLSYAWMKEGVCYHHQQTIKRPMPDKKLRLSWETFRDRLTPGQQEEWSLKIQNPDGTPADASLLAVLYDKRGISSALITMGTNAINKVNKCFIILLVLLLDNAKIVFFFSFR